MFITFANSPYGLCGRKGTLYMSCMKVEVAVLGSPSLIAKIINANFVFIIFANSPYGLWGRKATLYRSCMTVEVANCPYGLWGRKATLYRSCMTVEVANSPYGLWGRKATLYRSCMTVEVANSPYGLCGRGHKAALQLGVKARWRSRTLLLSSGCGDRAARTLAGEGGGVPEPPFAWPQLWALANWSKFNRNNACIMLNVM